MKKIATFIVFLLVSQTIKSQVTLDADGPGYTYELITSVLCPNTDGNPIEVPDCNHSQFGEHITEVYDSDLNSNVFKFHIHVDSDNDRCKNFDRQRNEIKSYDKSPDYLLGVEGETVEYKWKFKLNSNYKSSRSFTHIHQLKAKGGSEESMPLITLTTKDLSHIADAENDHVLQLRYAKNTNQKTIYQTALDDFLGNWVAVTELVTYGEAGSYSIKIKRVSDNKTLYDFSDSTIRMWKTGATFLRPKWGIYRSLNYPNMLRDESLLFSNFKITENPILSTTDFDIKKIKTFPNPVGDELTIYSPKNNIETAVIYSIEG